MTKTKLKDVPAFTRVRFAEHFTGRTRSGGRDLHGATGLVVGHAAGEWKDGGGMVFWVPDDPELRPAEGAGGGETSDGIDWRSSTMQLEVVGCDYRVSWGRPRRRKAKG